MRPWRTRTVDTGIPGVSADDQERVYAARREQEGATSRENYEWAATMRDRQRLLLGDQHPQAPAFGPGLDLPALANTLREV